MKIESSTTTLLRGILLPDEMARSHLDAWCRHADLDAVDPATHRLLPLLYSRLADLGMAPPELERLRGVYRKTWYRNQRHLEAVKRAAEVLTEANIELTLFRGLALALGAYAEVGLRTVDAAQAVVTPETTASSIDKLTNAGFAVDGRIGLPGFGLPTRLIYRGGGRIDIHEFVYGPGWPGRLDQRLRMRRMPLQLDGLPIGTLAPSDGVAAVAAFGLSIPVSKYQCLVDLTVLSRQTDPSVEWTDLIDGYRDTPLSVPIAEAFAAIADEIPGALPSGPQDLVGEMLPTRRQHLQYWLHRRGRRLARLPAWYRRANSQAGSGNRVGFVRFAKEVYHVDGTRDAFNKALRKVKRGLGSRSS